MKMICEKCDRIVKAFTLPGLGRAMQRHLIKCKGGKQKMETGEEYLVLQIGDIRIPFFPAKSKAGKKYFQTSVQIWKNEKGQKKEVKKEEPLTIETQKIK